MGYRDMLPLYFSQLYTPLHAYVYVCMHAYMYMYISLVNCAHGSCSIGPVCAKMKRMA